MVPALAIAAMAAACSSDTTVDEPKIPAEPATGTRTITVSADIADTRTALTEGRDRLRWSEGDTFGVFTDNEDDRNIESSA
ncbi:MAG: hypothetical protein K2J33_06230, partial [Alistipes sp.]|nr:hypothetical protein [Alistipes sp.]